MTVYIIRRINDYEYGCRNIEGVFDDPIKADAYITERGNQCDIEFAYGTPEKHYIVEPWEVQ